jgi:hypothetical protein
MTGKKRAKRFVGGTLYGICVTAGKRNGEELLMIRQKQKKVNFNNVMGEEGRIKSERNVTTKSQSIW